MTEVAHVISLESRPEAFDQVASDFEPYGFSCVKELGLTGGLPPIECTKTHFNLVRRASAAGRSEIIVFEDDCKPLPAMSQWPQIRSYLANNRHRWDLFYGGATSVHPLHWHCGHVGSGHYIVQCIRALSVHFVVYNFSSFAKAQEWFELRCPEADRPAVDVYLQNSGLRILTAVPMLAVQRPSYSRTLGRMADYSASFQRAEAKLEMLVETRRRSWAFRLFGRWLNKV